MIRLRTLGECAIEVGARRVGPEAGHVFGLLLFLAIERGKHVARGTLVDHFWPGTSDEKARHCLRQALYKVRLLGAAVESTSSHVELDASSVTGDFIELADGGRVDVDRLRVGGAAFGEFLPGYAPPFSPAFAEWLEAKRDFVHAQVRRALSNALLECRSAHRWADVDAVARHCLALDPLNEEATLALAEATALTGSKAQALSMLDRFMAELGPEAGDIRLPATLLRRRIAERLPTHHYSAASDALFVGRDHDLAVLGGLVREARAGRGQACIVWGDPGIGKSRLAAECAKGAALQGARVQRVGCQASDAVRPLSVFVDVVPKLQTMPGALGCSPESLAYLRRLTEHDAKSRTPSEEAQEAAYLHGRIRRALLDLVDAIAEEAPLVLVVEDVHWLDAQSWDVFREMIDWAAERRMLFIFTSRTPTPTEQAAPRLPGRLVSHHLGALDAAASASLLDAVVHDHQRALDPDFRAWCVGVSEGNPLFLRQMARQWVETGDRAKVPATLAAVIAERLSRLRPTSMRLLQASAILGKNSTFERLEAVTDYKKFELLDAVEELEAAGLLVAGAGSGVQVRHELIANAALQRINEGTRRLLHRNSARVLEAEIEATKSAALLWDYTAHCTAAAELERVVGVITTVGDHLVEVGLPAEACAIYERALNDDYASDDRLLLLRNLANSSLLAGLWGNRAQTLEAIAELEVKRSPLESTHTDTELDLLEAEWRAGASLGTVLSRMLACLDDQRADDNHRARAAEASIRSADMAGDLKELTRVHGVAATLRPNTPDGLRALMMCDVVYHSICGDLAEACLVARRVVDVSRSTGSPIGVARALVNARIPLGLSGRLEEASDVAHEALAISERHRFDAIRVMCADALGSLALERGEAERAKDWYIKGMQWSDHVQDPLFVGGLSYLGARIAVLEGDWEGAASNIPAQGEDILRDDHIRRRTASIALHTLVSLMTGRLIDPPRAISQVADSFLRARALGSQDFTAYCLITLLSEVGESETAHSTLEEYAARNRRELSPLPAYLARLL